MNHHEMVLHTLEPWFDEHAKVLILGTMPSPKSREYGCYYGHPQNRFWTTLGHVFKTDIPLSSQERKSFVLEHHIALWDVLESCEIHGANDASITNPKPNDLSLILDHADIQVIFTTGTKAKQLYDRYIHPVIGLKAIGLPSTSPANRRWASDESLLTAYQQILKYI